MDDSLDRILACPREIAWVKLADRVANLSEPPATWTPEKCAGYRAEAERIPGVGPPDEILERLGPTSPALAQRLRDRIAAYRQYEQP
jgi:hypothetical protein